MAAVTAILTYLFRVAISALVSWAFMVVFILGCRSTRKVGRTCALAFVAIPATPDNRKSVKPEPSRLTTREREIFFDLERSRTEPMLELLFSLLELVLGIFSLKLRLSSRQSSLAPYLARVAAVV